ncbi:MAG: hypothetical protein KGL43_25095 [Burkholderiales bacterium]|nr:hypothetical protein [Burkholderiales bacterium]MDE2395507.1 hypothetical protein [Burkholderiales bacterium]MDE2456880.1 hypothetical protein [Burkholderiales bacterium]
MSRLDRPIRRFAQESAWLSHEFGSATKQRSDTNRLICEMAVVRLHDSWARCCRELIVQSACGRTTTISGTWIDRAPAVTGEGSVIPALLATFKSKKSEPKWFDAGECIDSAQRLKVENLTAIAGALGATTSPAEKLRHVRNFYAHRGQYTAREAARHATFTKPQMPDVFELGKLSHPDLSHLDEWIMGLTDTLRAAAQ